MYSEFKKIKKRLLLYEFIKSAALGFAASMVIVALVFAALKLSGIDVGLTLYIVGCLSAGVIVTAVLFLIFRPSDKKTARLADNELRLAERVSTMIAFRDSDTELVRAQRTDTEERLATRKPKFVTPRQVCVIVLSLLVSVSMLVGSLFVPLSVSAEPEEPPIGDFEHQWILDRLNALIEIVENSFVVDDVKSFILGELNTLYSAVESSDKTSEMKDYAITALLNVNNEVERVNLAPDLAVKIMESDTEVLKKLGDELATLSGTAFKKQSKKVKSYITSSEDPKETALLVYEEIDAYIRLSMIPLDSDLYKLFKSFANNVSEAGESGDMSKLDDAFDALDSALPDMLLAERDNRTVGDTVVNELALIFNITDDDLEGEEGGADIEIDKTPTVQPEEPENDKDMSTEGGFAEGGSSYASDDLVYSPELDAYVTYGEILDFYFAKYNDKRLDGELAEELLEALKAYFDGLY